MAGIIEVTASIHWTAASWLFDWTLKALAEEVRDPDLSAILSEVVDENLGWLGVGELTHEQRKDLVVAATQSLGSRAESGLPLTIGNREHLVMHVQDLVDLMNGLHTA